ncbi:MAG: adenine phosphoribosyltransferase [candidate division KSB1 bacterium]|nr:adenine phosphoribosyltransferase [candidate division KSB1 bacterium]
MNLAEKIRSIPDFPKKGIVFRDITTLLGDGHALREAVEKMYDQFRDVKIDKVVGIESRGFIFAALLAYKFGIGMVPARKPGKLPYQTISEDYELEYGVASLQMHIDAIQKGEKVLIVDDLLATGGTVGAAARLVERLGGQVVGFCFLIELDFLGARNRLRNYRIESLIHYESE